MKKVLVTMMMVSSLIVLMTSCQKEAINKNSTNDPSVTSVTAGRGGILPKAPTYQLTKKGNDSLTYYNDGRLAKVQHSAFSYTQYNYGFNTVIAKTYGGGKVDEEVTYQVDVITGHVYESQHTGYSYYSAGTIVVDKTYQYQYDADGHLVNRFNKNSPKERAAFNWNEGNLSNIAWYNAAGNKIAVLEFVNQFNLKPNKLKLHSSRSGLDPYLNIFGKPCKSLLPCEYLYSGLNLTLSTSEIFYYELNDDGYPIKCSVGEADSGKIFKTINFSYNVIP